jgi:hypothetical protein
MTDDLRKAAEMALEALEFLVKNELSKKGSVKAHFRLVTIPALRQALAQPERKWVGLTKEDFYKKDDETVFVLGMKFAEARLKEKNT